MSNTNESDCFRASGENNLIQFDCYIWGRIMEDESTNITGTKISRIWNTRLFHEQETITKCFYQGSDVFVRGFGKINIAVVYKIFWLLEIQK